MNTLNKLHNLHKQSTYTHSEVQKKKIIFFSDAATLKIAADVRLLGWFLVELVLWLP